MRVFVTGVDGYIGAVLAPYLMARGIEVVGLDTGYYRDGWLYGGGPLGSRGAADPQQGPAPGAGW